tara:strand:+ start:3536 stop:4171 length:636 start_codon:yes stop_codon:yes gene_type:complete
MQQESNLKVRELFSIPLLKMKVWEDTDELNDCEDYILSKLQVTNPQQAQFANRSDKYRILERYPKTKQILLNYTRSSLDKMGYACNFDISTSWLTLNKKGEHVQLHNHKNCYWSAVYYYGHYERNGGGELDLLNPLPDLSSYKPNLKNINKFTTPITKVIPERKHLIIFPSFLNHTVTPVQSDIPRKSLAFNIVPIGNYGDGDSTYDTTWY